MDIEWPPNHFAINDVRAQSVERGNPVAIQISQSLGAGQGEISTGGGIDYTLALATLYLDFTHQALDLNSDRSPVVLDGNANILSASVSLHF